MYRANVDPPTGLQQQNTNTNVKGERPTNMDHLGGVATQGVLPSLRTPLQSTTLQYKEGTDITPRRTFTGHTQPITNSEIYDPQPNPFYNPVRTSQIKSSVDPPNMDQLKLSYPDGRQQRPSQVLPHRVSQSHPVKFGIRIDIPPTGYSTLPAYIMITIYSYIPEVTDLTSALLACKGWSWLFYDQNTWMTLCKLRIPDVQPTDIQYYQDSWLNLYMHLLKTEYFYLPHMYTHVYFSRKRKQPYYNSRGVIVHFPNGDIIQFVVPANTLVGQLVEIITQAINLDYLTSAYNLQKREGDFAKPQWLHKEKTLEEQGVEERHILRFNQQFYLSIGQFDLGHVQLLYPQVRDYVISGNYLCTREEALNFAVLQMTATHGKNAESRLQNIVRTTLNSRFHNDEDIGLEILTSYQDFLEKYPHITKMDAKLMYLNCAKSLRMFGASIFTLNNSALTCAICPGTMYIMKSATGHILDQWQLERAQSFELKENRILIHFGKYHKVVELTPKPTEAVELHESIVQYAKFLSDCRQGKINIKLLIDVYFGPPTNEYKITINTCTSDRVDTLIRNIEKMLGMKRDPEWGLVLSNGEWLYPPDFVGKYDLDKLTLGVRYRPRRSPTFVQLADGSLLLTHLDYSMSIEIALNDIGDVLGITPTGLGLSLGSTLLSYHDSMSQQGVSPFGEQVLNCIHCILPSHDITNEISLDLGYARAKHVIHNFSIPYLSSDDLRELNELEHRIDTGIDRPVARLPTIVRYLTIISKEVIFLVYRMEDPFELIITEENIRLRETNTGSIVGSWAIGTLNMYNVVDDGVSLTFGLNEEIHLRTIEAYEIHKCISSIIEMVLWKKDRTRNKKKLLPIHDPDHEVTLREGRYMADQIVNKLREGQLEYLDLSWSAIRGNDIRRICSILAVDECVKNINMSGYGYGTNEILVVLDTIKSSELVETLNLSYCGLDDSVAYKIGEMLKVNKSIKILNITLNPFTEVGIGYLLQGLKANTTIKYIHVQIPDLGLAQDSYWFERAYSLKLIK